MEKTIFGDWTIIRDAENRNKKRYVVARCICGVEKTVQLGNIKSGSSKRCDKCGYEARAKKNRLKGDQSGLVNKRCAFGRYKQGAVKRGLNFSITLDEFLDLASKNCYYCDSEPSNCYNLTHSKGPRKGKPRAGKPFIHNGIDRLDSDKGYDRNNCVPCCKKCNIAKSSMGELEFYDWIGRVFNHCKQRIKNGKSLSPCLLLCEEVGWGS